jgi:hypothetical protein
LPSSFYVIYDILAIRQTGASHCGRKTEEIEKLGTMIVKLKEELIGIILW